MFKFVRITSAVVALALVCGLSASAQENSSPTASDSQKAAERHHYRLDFRVLEFSPEGKLTNSRNYSEVIGSGAGPTSSIRSGDRVPISLGGNSWNTYDIGVNIDSREAEEVDKQLCLYLTAKVTTLSSAPPASIEHEITRTMSWESYVTVPIGKATIVFSSDNAADHGKTQLEVTATPLR
jgi:hypothetical protein